MTQEQAVAILGSPRLKAGDGSYSLLVWHAAGDCSFSLYFDSDGHLYEGFARPPGALDDWPEESTAYEELSEANGLRDLLHSIVPW
jgi:hypothetical protein